jgi:hypothetical protein
VEVRVRKPDDVFDHDVSGTRLLGFSAAGFAPELAAASHGATLVDLPRLYTGF